MTRLITAIFEDGVLKPTEPLQGIPEQTMVKIIMETIPPTLTKEEKLAMLLNGPVSEELASAIEEGRKQPWQIQEF